MDSFGPRHDRPLPLVTLYLTERCNSRCISCDHWRTGRTDLSAAQVAGWGPALQKLGTKVVLFSGGEPLLHPEWPAMAASLSAQGLQVWLLTAGLALAKQADAVARHFDSVTVSLDGTSRETYLAVRGVDAFDAVCEGVRRVAALGRPAQLRVTVQRANFRELSRLVELAHGIGAAGVSFLAADVGNAQAFGRESTAGLDEAIALRREELAEFAAALDELERAHAADFASHFIAETPVKLRRLLQYFAALRGVGDFPVVRCNAPEFSAVVEADGRLRPCFFIPGPGAAAGATLLPGLNDPLLVQLRADIRQGRRAECQRCVCSMWRAPHEAAAFGRRAA